MKDYDKALESIEFCLKAIENPRIKAKDNVIWSCGMTSKPHITQEILEMAAEALKFKLNITNEYHDVSVINRDSLDDDFKEIFSLPWLCQFSDGYIFQFYTEEEACAFQRKYRKSHNRDEMTGELII